VKSIEVTFPKDSKQDVEEVFESYDFEPAFIDVEKEGKKLVKAEFVESPDNVDSLVERLKKVKSIDNGDLTIEISDQAAYIEKGKRRRDGSSSISVNEMYSKAFDFSSFDLNSWALISIASLIAVFGLVSSNIIVVIGAMVIAPMLGPFMSSSFGLVIGDRKIIHQSLLYGTGSIFLAIATSMLISVPFNFSTNELMLLIAEPGFTTVPLSLSVGAASALAFSTEARETLAGIAVAIALVPPSAVAGIAIASSNFQLFSNVFLVILSNTMSLVLAGSITFKLLGVSPSTYYRKKVSEKSLKRALYISTTVLVVIATIVAYISIENFEDANLEAEAASVLESRLGESIISQEIVVEQENLKIKAHVVGEYNIDSLRQELESITDRDVELDIVGLQTAN